MQIVESKVTPWLQTNSVNHIARCARVCYASNKTTNDQAMCDALWKNKHRSMFRHAGVYYIIPEKIQISEKAYIGTVVRLVFSDCYVSTNEQCAKEYWDERYSKYRINTSEAFKDLVFLSNGMLRITLCIETGIDITREYNRKSPNNIAEQSTRYVDFNKKVGIRFKKCHWMEGINLYKKCLTKIMCKTAEWFYKLSRSKYGLNLPPQDARWILPLDTMSKVVYTYTIKEWEEILNMREFDYTGKAHPDAKAVACQIHKQLDKLGYIIHNYNYVVHKTCSKNTIYPDVKCEYRSNFV
jgi:thymidylate synthase (FAD)|nr:MAG TPA: Thymidylate synthase complementing protein [Crassvirales sp.]